MMSKWWLSSLPLWSHSVSERLSHTHTYTPIFCPQQACGSARIMCWMFWIEPSINTTKHFPSLWWSWCTHTHLCSALSLSKQPFYSEGLQWSGSTPAKTPFQTSSLLFSKSPPSRGPQGLPSFLYYDTQAWWRRREVRMAGCALIRHADRRMPLLLWTSGLVLCPRTARGMTSFLFW